MHQDQGDASQVNRAYAYAYGRLYIYGPLALEIERTNQVNQHVTEPYKVTHFNTQLLSVWNKTTPMWERGQYHQQQKKIRE